MFPEITAVKVALVILAPERSALVSVAPVRFAPVRSAYMRFAPVRFAPVRFTPERLAYMRSALERLAPVKSAPERSALVSVASVRLAYSRLAYSRLAYSRLALERLHPLRSTYAPRALQLLLSANARGVGVRNVRNISIPTTAITIIIRCMIVISFAKNKILACSILFNKIFMYQ